MPGSLGAGHAHQPSAGSGPFARVLSSEAGPSCDVAIGRSSPDNGLQVADQASAALPSFATRCHGHACRTASLISFSAGLWHGQRCRCFHAEPMHGLGATAAAWEDTARLILVRTNGHVHGLLPFWMPPAEEPTQGRGSAEPCTPRSRAQAHAHSLPDCAARPGVCSMWARQHRSHHRARLRPAAGGAA